MAEIEETHEEGMSFWDHLEVLRWALFRIACCLAICLVGTFMAMPHIFDKFILAPTTNDFFVYKWLTEISNGIIQFDPGFSVQIININVASQFMTHISTSCYLAFLFASPYILFELFRFVSPALYENEKRYSIIVVFVVYGLFILGLMMSYFVIFPISFQFLATYQVDPTINNTITLSSYISTFTTLTLMMGLVFQLPVIAFVLAKMGIVDTELLRHYRRHALVIITIIAAIITPTTDIFTLLLVTGPIYLLYELSIFVVKRVER